MALRSTSPNLLPPSVRLTHLWPINDRLEAAASQRTAQTAGALERYQFEPAAYIREQLGWEPWAGSAAHPGQQEVIAAYVLALRQQHERAAYESGELAADQLQHWQPGQVIKNRIRIEAGHTVGKTKLAAGLVSHFFDCFVPSIIYTFAPSWEQVHDLLWKEIKTDRRGKGLPGRILDLALERSDDHFAKGRATNNSQGQGTERAQGQHGKYLMFVLDEAEGIADFVYGAVDSMTSGGISIVLMLANPRTRTSKFHKAAGLSTVESFRISCIHHPNVLAGRELVPGAVKRQYVEMMIEQHCEVATAHSEDDQTFELPWRPGVIYRPDVEFLFRVMGVAPASIADNAFVPVGRYEAARARPATSDHPTVARFGIDAARYGNDMGTLYERHDGKVRRLAQFPQQDTMAYYQTTKRHALRLLPLGVTSLHIRIDAGGGFGSGTADLLKIDAELIAAFPDYQVIEVHFGGTPSDELAYADMATEMYADTAELLRRLALIRPPEALEADLCERIFKWITREGVSVRRLEPKEDFKRRIGRSPDDGDGCVLAAASDHLFSAPVFAPVVGGQRTLLATMNRGLRP